MSEIETQRLSALRPDHSTPSSEAPQGLTLTEVVRIVRTRRFLVLTVFLLALGGSVLYAVLATRQYEGVARLDIDPNRASASSLSDTLAQTLGDSQATSRVETEMKIMQSDSVLLRVVRRLNLPHRAPFTSLKSFRKDPVPPGSLDMTAAQTDELLKALGDGIKVSVAPGTTLVEVRYRSSDPVLASAVPNALVESYIEQDLSVSSAGEARVAASLMSEMDNLRDQASAAQTKLAEFQRQNHVVGVDEAQNVLVDKIRLLNQQMTQAQADRIIKESLLKVAETHDPKLLATLSQGATLQLLRAQQVDLQGQRDQVAAKFGPGYPKLQEMDYQLQRLNANIKKETDNIYNRFKEEYLSAKQSEDQLRAQFNEQEQAFYRLNEGAAQFAMLRHDAVSTRDLYDALQYKLKEAGVSEALKSTMIRIIDNARQTATPVAPKVPLVIAGGLFAGIFLGVGLALTIDSLDDKIRASTEVEEILHVPVLSVVPHISSKLPAVSEKSTSLAVLPVLDDRDSAAAEGYRQLRSNLFLSNLDNRPRLIIISSSHAGEGKSTTAINYAISLAMHGAQVLLIDTDLRRGTLHTRFRLPDQPGLTNVLSGNLKMEDIPRPVASLPNFALLCAGARAPDPSEVLNSNRMMAFLDECIQRFDYVILDSAPLLPVADSYALAVRADAVVLIVRAGLSRKKAVLRAIRQLSRLKANLSGVVVNDVDMRIEHYYTYGGKYGYYDYRGQA